MKKISLFVLCLLVVSITFGQRNCVKGSHDIKTETRTIGSFDEIEVRDAIDLYITQGDVPSIEIEADDNIIEYIKTEVHNGVLEIGTPNIRIKNADKMNVHITVTDLSRLYAAGASDVYIKDVLKVPSLKMEMRGASDFEGEIEVGKFEGHFSGASDADIEGKAGESKIKLSGSSDFMGKRFVMESCTLKASGSSDAELKVEKILDVRASGSSDIYYNKSVEKLDVDASGSCEIVGRRF